MAVQLLLVEPDDTLASKIMNSVKGLVNVSRYRDFRSARARLAQTPFGFVVTNLQLKEYNGLHLANVALSLGSAPTCIVYVHERLASLVRIVEETGAYFETAESLPGTLRGYIEEGVFSNREVAPCLKPHHDLPGRSN